MLLFTLFGHGCLNIVSDIKDLFLGVVASEQFLLPQGQWCVEAGKT